MKIKFIILIIIVIVSCKNKNLDSKIKEEYVRFNSSLSKNFVTGDIVNFYLKDNALLELVFIKGDTFVMGHNSGDINSRPEHTVILSDYFIGKYEITQKLWRAVMNNNPSYFKGDDLPVERVSWTFCQALINRINENYSSFSGGSIKGKFMLPTEAEW